MSNEVSLSELLASARSAQENLDLHDPRSQEFKDVLSSAIASLQQCSQLVDRLALFSSNEELEDISTNDLQYLGIDYLLAELTMRSYDASTRLAQLNVASTLLMDFITKMHDYSLLSKTNVQLLESYKDSPAAFRIVRDDAGLETRRNVKIKRFQDEKALKSKLKLLREQSQSLNVDDEVVRNLFVAELDLNVHNAFQTLDMVTQERQVLKEMPDQTTNQADIGAQDSRDRRNGSKQEYSERLDPSTLLNSNRPHKGILDSSGKPLQPFTITSKRGEMRKGVFGPGHSLPTMSIDEYLEEERKRGGIIEGGGPASEVVREPDEDDLAAVDAATLKAREWDEFTEANPKGAGNKINRG